MTDMTMLRWIQRIRYGLKDEWGYGGNGRHVLMCNTLVEKVRSCINREKKAISFDAGEYCTIGCTIWYKMYHLRRKYWATLNRLRTGSVVTDHL